MKHALLSAVWPPALLLLMSLSACHRQDDENAHRTPAALPADEVLLPENSTKRALITERPVEFVAAPVMEPIAGKIAYDETRTVRIAAPVAGRIVSDIPVLGKRVAAHEVLIELDSPELGQAEEDHANALADQRLAEGAWSRAKTLYDNGVLPHKELQQAENALAHARDDVRRTLMHLRNLGVTDDQINNRYLLRAPIPGVITERHVNPGMEVRPDRAEPLFVISDLRFLSLLMNVFEKDLGLVHVGTEVLVGVPAYPGRAFPAAVEYIDKLVDESTRTVKVRCKLANPEELLMPAMYATVEIRSGPGDKAAVVPLTALFTEDGGDQVFVKLGEGHYRQRGVRVRLRLKDRAVIADGLQPGETIVAEGALLLRTEEANEQTAEPPGSPH